MAHTSSTATGPPVPFVSPAVQVKITESSQHSAVAASPSGESAGTDDLIRSTGGKLSGLTKPVAAKALDDDELIWLGGDPHSPPVSVNPSPIRPLASAIELVPRGDTALRDVLSDEPASYDSPTSLIYYHHHPSYSTLATRAKCSAASKSRSSVSSTSALEAKIAAAERATRKRPCHLINLGDNVNTARMATEVDDNRGEVTPVNVKDDVLLFSPAASCEIDGWSAPRLRLPFEAESPCSPGEDQMLTPTAISHDPLAPHLLRQGSSVRPFLLDSKDENDRFDARANDPQPLDLDPDELNAPIVEVDKSTFGEEDSLQELVERTGKVAKLLRTKSL
ncbi:hypothetical protein IAT40_002308 [Kwoniella sp. CBS 6097]